MSIGNNFLFTVINVTLPDEKQNYVHRIGRVGRAERYGCNFVFSFLSFFAFGIKSNGDFSNLAGWVWPCPWWQQKKRR